MLYYLHTCLNHFFRPNPLVWSDQRVYDRINALYGYRIEIIISVRPREIHYYLSRQKCDPPEAEHRRIFELCLHYDVMLLRTFGVRLPV